jgi:ATP-dependent Lhr-like helicase
LANRTLAILIGHILSEKTGYPISIQEDPYRIIIKSSNVSNLKTIKDILFEISTINVKKTLIQALAKTGLFKRRMIHVARRFGAISEGADFSNISLSQLIKSFQETVIFDEAIKETLSSDIDLPSLNHFLQRVVNGEVDVVIIEGNKGITPIAKIGLQKIRSKSIISPEKMKRLAIESVKARILNEVRTFVCTNCWDFIQMTNILNLADPLICSKCGSNRIGILKLSEDEVRKICNKRGKLTVKEKGIEEKAVKTAKLISKYGRAGALILMGKNLRLSDIMKVLKEAENENKDLFELIVKAERRVLRERFV